MAKKPVGIFPENHTGYYEIKEFGTKGGTFPMCHDFQDDKPFPGMFTCRKMDDSFVAYSKASRLRIREHAPMEVSFYRERQRQAERAAQIVELEDDIEDE